MIKESNTPPSSWHIARAIENYPGKNNLVRVVKLKTSNWPDQLQRLLHCRVQKLCFRAGRDVC